jgi:hypothetical protein
LESSAINAHHTTDMFAVDSMLSQKIKEQYKSLTAKPIVQSVA